MNWFKNGLKVYVGAKYCERATAKRLMKALEAQGHHITCDWTQHTKEDATSAKFYATEDVKGVKQCDVAIFIMERPHKYKGCWVEMGVALGNGRKVIIIGHAGDSCVFVDHPNVMVLESMETLLFQPLDWWIKSYREFVTETRRIQQEVNMGKTLPFTDANDHYSEYEDDNSDESIEDCKTVNCKLEPQEVKE